MGSELRLGLDHKQVSLTCLSSSFRKPSQDGREVVHRHKAPLPCQSVWELTKDLASDARHTPSLETSQRPVQ